MKVNVRLGPELNLYTMGQLDMIEMTYRLGVSKINAIYDHLGLMEPITIKYTLVLQKICGR